MILRLRTFFCVAMALLGGGAPGATADEPAEPPPGRLARESLHHWRRQRLRVTALAFRPDGKALAAAYFLPAAGADGAGWRAAVAHWDLATGRPVTLEGAFAPLGFAADGEGIELRVAADASESSGDKIATRPAVWRPGGKALRLVGGDGAPGGVLTTSPAERARQDGFVARSRQGLKAFLAGGKALLYGPSGAAGRRQHLPRAADLRLLRYLPAAGGGAAAFSPDGRQVAAADRRGIVRIWDVQTRGLARTLRLDDRPAETFLAAAVQCHSRFGQPARNREKLAGLVRQAARCGAKVVVLPEAAVSGYLTADLSNTWHVAKRPIGKELTGVDPKGAAESVPGPSTRFFGRLADELGVYLTVPLVEVDRKTGAYYNTSVLLGPDGKVLIHYRKRDPWPWAERSWATAGDRGNPVVDTPFGRFGLLICYDIHDQARIMGRLKVDTLLYSIAWVDDDGSDWFCDDLPDIAEENGFNIVAANWTVPKRPEPAWHGYGQSRIIAASGRVVTSVSDDLADGVVLAELPVSAAGDE